MYPLIRNTLFLLPPENAHHFALTSLDIAANLGFKQKVSQKPCEVMGLKFNNPVGLAAGFDKDAEHIKGLSSLGFGFIEVGTVTPRPQSGNAKPRLFRLKKAKGLINRFGFNNKGVDALISRVNGIDYQGILGINIGKNKTTSEENAYFDYLTGLQAVYPFADYITINISSPNTKDLRNLQLGDKLAYLLEVLKEEQAKLADQYNVYRPLVVKIAPDIEEDALKSMAETFLHYKIDGVIATNTTISRQGVEGLPHGQEVGGLSGKPLFEKSTRVIEKLYALLQEDIPLIATGGIFSIQDAKAKLQAGAKLIQLYTGFIYQGPNLIKDIIHSL